MKSALTSRDTGRAVSPVLAVILLVAITVVLSTTVGLFVLDLGESVDDSSTQNLGIRSTTDGGTVTATVVTGEADEVELQVNGTVEDTATSVSPGTTLSAAATADSDITVIAVQDGDRQVVSSDNPLRSAAVSGSAVPTDGLVGYWTMDDADVSADTLADQSGYGNDGSIVGDPVTDAPGVQGNSFNFDGTDDGVIVPRDTSLEPQTVTFAAWVKSETSTWNEPGWALAKRDGEHEGYLIHPQGGSEAIRVYIGGSDGSWHYIEHTPTDITQWHHYVGRYDGETLTMFVDGEKVGEKTPTVDIAYPDSTTDLHLGTDGLSGRDGQGNLDDVRVYERALADSEVQDLYDETK